MQAMACKQVRESQQHAPTTHPPINTDSPPFSLSSTLSGQRTTRSAPCWLYSPLAYRLQVSHSPNLVFRSLHALPITPRPLPNIFASFPGLHHYITCCDQVLSITLILRLQRRNGNASFIGSICWRRLARRRFRPTRRRAHSRLVCRFREGGWGGLGHGDGSWQDWRSKGPGLHR